MKAWFPGPVSPKLEADSVDIWKIELNLSTSTLEQLEAWLSEEEYQRAVGVDIEFIRDGLADEQIARRFFSKREVADLLSLPIKLRRHAFFNCWTRKEAYIKARGEGLSMPLNAIDVAIRPGEPVEIIRTRPDPAQALQWKLYALQPDDGYVAAISAEGQPDFLHCWQWSGPTCN